MLLTKGRVVLAIVASGALLASHYGMYQWGYAGAAGDERSACQTREIDGLTFTIAQLQAMTLQASRQSREIDQVLSERQLANETTTEELNDALAETANDRSDCLFPVGVMRQLAAARARAAEAAASGITGSLSAPDRDE